MWALHIYSKVITKFIDRTVLWTSLWTCLSNEPSFSCTVSKICSICLRSIILLSSVASSGFYLHLLNDSQGNLENKWVVSTKLNKSLSCYRRFKDYCYESSSNECVLNSNKTNWWPRRWMFVLHTLCGGSQQAVRMQIFTEAAATQFEVGMSQDSVGGWKRMKE